MTATRNSWQRVRKDRLCPICERPDWCLLSADGTAAICARIESSKRCGEAGWLHRLQDAVDRPFRRQPRLIPLVCKRGPDAGLVLLAARCQGEVDPGRLHQLAQTLGLSAKALVALGIGWSADHRAWSFPMTNEAGDVLGIRLRRPSGFKFSVAGGKEGLFLPSNPPGDGPLLISEGPTDTAALLDFGFTNVVGRPSCTGGIKLLVGLVRQRQPKEVVIVADSDEPGQRGAGNLASVLVAYVPSVKIITPPAGVKDARAWLQSGGEKSNLEEAIAAAPAKRLTVRALRS